MILASRQNSLRTISHGSSLDQVWSILLGLKLLPLNSTYSEYVDGCLNDYSMILLHVVAVLNLIHFLCTWLVIQYNKHFIVHNKFQETGYMHYVWPHVIGNKTQIFLWKIILLSTPTQ